MSLKRQLVIMMMTLCITVSFFGQMPAAHAAAKMNKATWVWNAREIVNHSQDLLSFTERNGINVVYLQISDGVAVPKYKAFIRQASEQGLQIYALNGSPAMAQDAGRKQLTAFLDWVEAYQQKAEASEKFAGIHVDIEPYLLPEWKTQRETLIGQWQSSMEFICKRAEQLHLQASADMPFWFDEFHIPNGQMTLSSWLIERFDSITIMAYRDSAEQIFSISESELMDAERQGKSLILAVETNPSNETKAVTLYEEGGLYMDEQLLRVEASAGKYKSFGGFAVHDYKGWKALRK